MSTIQPRASSKSVASKKSVKTDTPNLNSTITDIEPNEETVRVSKDQLEIEKQQKKLEKLASEEKINVAFSDPSHGESKHLIYTKDNKAIPEIETDSVHLAVTSPPYFNAREYSNWATLDDYLKDKSIREDILPG